MISCFDHSSLTAAQGFPQCISVSLTCCFDCIHMHIWLHTHFLKYKSLFLPCINPVYSFHCFQPVPFILSISLPFLSALWLTHSFSCSGSFGSVTPEQSVVCLWCPLSPVVIASCLRGRDNMLCGNYLTSSCSP